MEKIDIHGQYQKYPGRDEIDSKRYREDSKYRSNEDQKHQEWLKTWEVLKFSEFFTKDKPNMRCDCGCEDFKVCWIDYPFCGGYCRIVCSKCEQSIILINDFA